MEAAVLVLVVIAVLVCMGVIWVAAQSAQEQARIDKAVDEERQRRAAIEAAGRAQAAERIEEVKQKTYEYMDRRRPVVTSLRDGDDGFVSGAVVGAMVAGAVISTTPSYSSYSGGGYSGGGSCGGGGDGE